MNVLSLFLSLSYLGVFHDVASSAICLVSCLIGLLRIRTDVNYVDVSDDDSQLGEISVTSFVEKYGHLPTAVIYTSVETLACLRFVFRDRLQDSRKHMLPVVRRRARALFSLMVDYTISRAGSLLNRASRTPTVAAVSRSLTPAAPILEHLHENLCLHFGNDYMKSIPKRAVSFVSCICDALLDSITRRAHQSTLLWMVYVTLSIWVGLLLCGVSLALAFASPYILLPGSPKHDKIVSGGTGPPLSTPLPDAADSFQEGQMPAILQNDHRYINRYFQCSSMDGKLSPLDHDIEVSPSLDLSTILADPRAQVSSLMLFQIQPFVPEIHITPADESVDVSIQLESFADRVDYDAFVEGVTSEHENSTVSVLPTFQSGASFAGLSLMLSSLEHSNVDEVGCLDEIGCLDYSWEDDLFMIKPGDRFLSTDEVPASAVAASVFHGHKPVRALETTPSATQLGNADNITLELALFSELSIAKGENSTSIENICTAGGAFVVQQADILQIDTETIEDNSADTKEFTLSQHDLNDTEEVHSWATLLAPVEVEVSALANIFARSVDTVSVANAGESSRASVNASASQATLLAPAEAKISTSITTVKDANYSMATDKGTVGQAGNAETILTHAEIEFLAVALVELDIDAVHAMCGTVFDDILFPEKSSSAIAAPPCVLLAPTPAPVPVAQKAGELLDRFAECQAPHTVPMGSKLYSRVQRPTPEVVIARTGALWPASVRAGAGALRQGKPPTPPLMDSMFHAHQRVTEGAENRPRPALWAPGRAGAIPIVAPPPSRRKRAAGATEASPVRAKAAAERRADWLARRTLL